MIDLDPTIEWAWFDLGLFAKRRRDWSEAARLNERALALSPVAAENPAAWNLGIAATAMADWRLARKAWTAYGIPVPDGEGPILANFGSTPVRLNPPPRHVGETPLQLDGRGWQSEVVWCRRLCPARAEIANIPLPESGHRRGDVVLHDGEPVGQRAFGDRTFAVFNELARLTKSSEPTCRVAVTSPTEADVQALLRTIEASGLAAEDWTSSINVYCRACSEGDETPHDHRPQPAEWTADRQIGLAGAPEQFDELLTTWARAAPGRISSSIELVL